MLRIAFIYLVYVSLPVGAVLVYFVVRGRRLPVRILLGILAVPHLVAGGVLLYDVHFSRNGAEVDRQIVLETWDAVSDGLHNSNTDMVALGDDLYLIHQASPYHLGTSEARLVVRRSTDGGRNWNEVARIDGGDLDIRDPKFMIVGDRIYVYVLMNRALNPEPFTTLYTYSDNGTDWAPLRETGHPEWLFWRPRQASGLFYVPAYYYEHGESILLTSEDGESWTRHANIYSGGRNDETAIAILPDGEMLVTGRLEYSDSVFGHVDGATLIARSEPPYDSFEKLTEDQSNRLDGPALFVWQGRVFAVGRRQPKEYRPWAMMGSAFTRKRTSVFEVTREGLVWLTDLPSDGDTSYPAVVLGGDEALVCYYTSNIRRDHIWLTGLLLPSSIRMARIDLNALLAAADS